MHKSLITYLLRHCKFVRLSHCYIEVEVDHSIREIVRNGPKMLDKDDKELHPFTQRGKMTKTPHLFCSLCQAVPYDYHLDERGNIQGKLFATIRDLKNHYISYHDFEFTDMDPEFDQDFAETLTWSFGICEECDALCLTEESLNFHKQVSHNSINTEKIYRYFQFALYSNDGKIDKRVQRRHYVESFLKSHGGPQIPNKPRSWQTEGDPDAYDLDKVLRELNEVTFDMVVV